MKTNVAHTSLKTYDALVAAGELEPKEAAIIALFGPATKISRNQIMHMAKFPINTVTGRVASLIEKGKLIEEGVRIDPVTHKPQKLLRLPQGQLELIV